MTGSIAIAPSALEPLPGLTRALDLPDGQVLVLREDLIGLAGGGNKVRKAVAALERARDDGVRTVVTTGAPQSNHARATAIVGARLGLRVLLVVEGAPPARLEGNLVLDDLAGAELHWTEGADAPATAATLAADAPGPARVVPFGGSDAPAVEVYAQVGADLLDRVPDVQHVVVAVGSGATAAGLVVAAGARRVLGVDTGAVEDASGTVRRLLEEARPDVDWSAQLLRIDDREVGEGYASLPPRVRTAVSSALRSDGIVFDVTYAGRALSAMTAALESGEIGRGERTVLVHTGGVPGALGHDALRRPAAGA